MDQGFAVREDLSALCARPTSPSELQLLLRVGVIIRVDCFRVGRDPRTIEQKLTDLATFPPSILFPIGTSLIGRLLGGSAPIQGPAKVRQVHIGG